MFIRIPSVTLCVYLAATAVAFAQKSYVFQLPGPALTGLPPQVVGYGDDSFARIAGPAISQSLAGANKIAVTPNGSKFYILTTGGILAGNSTLSALTPVSAIAEPGTDAAVTPDGKYLLVAANHFYILKTATDSLAIDADTGIPSGGIPVSVAASQDGKTAWILARSNTGSTVTALDLTSFETAANRVNLPSGVTSMVLSPRGLLYVTTSGNTVFEIDPVSMTVTNFGQMQVPGVAGPLRFTPDGANAYFVNRTVCTSGNCSPIFKLNVQAHSISTWLPSGGGTLPTLEDVLVAGNNRVFAFSSESTALYDVTPTPLALTASALSSAPAFLPTSTVVAAAVSNENPTSRYLYLLFADHTFIRVNLANNGIDQSRSLDPAQGLLLPFVSIPVTSGATSLSLINNSQTVAPSGTAVLVAQVLDAVGRPVFGVPVSFSADPASGIAFTTPTLTSTAGGWAQTTITAPSAVGNYTVTVTSGTLSSNFSLSVSGTGPGGSSGGSGSPQISIYAGDGQLLLQNQSTQLTTTHEPLTVKIVDATGTPIPNVSVSFQVSEGIGSVLLLNQSITDEAGLARAHYTSANLPPNTPVLLSKVIASSIYGSVEFYEVTHREPFNSTKPPNSDIVTPVGSRAITVPQGGVLPAGIAVFTYREGTARVPIPNVGLRLADTVDLTAPSQIASCRGLSRGDNSGISRCDVEAFCQPNVSLPRTFGAVLSVGEYQQFNFTIEVTNGVASVLNPVSALNQTGTPGSTFTLFARVSDGCGQNLPASGLTWGIIQGSASGTLSQVQTSSDSNGNVSARLTLGQTAGLVQVQLSGLNLAPVVFKITNQVSLSSITVVSGNGQSAGVGKAFTNPLVFVVRDANGNPLPGVLIGFSATGGGVVSPASATSNAQGLVETSVTAGPNAGTIVVTAASGSVSAPATLSSLLAGPTVTSTSFRNAASSAVGLTPCGLATVTGAGLAPAFQGVVSGVNAFAPLPLTLAGVSITVNGFFAPIQAVANQNNVEQVNFQVPCDVAPGTATVVVTVSGVSTTVANVQVLAVQPGIFAWTGSNNRQYGAVIRAVDGTYVTAANPARRGDRLYVVVTGLGLVTPGTFTGAVGTGSQNVNLPVIVGVADRGVPVLSARYLFGATGAYLVEFQLPADHPLGNDQALAVAALTNNGTTFVFGNPVFLAAVAP